MKLFKKEASVPQSYRPVLEATEVLELFARMTLHQQAALMRLMSRNLMIEMNGELHMGYDFDWNVDAAMIVATPADTELLLGEGSNTP